MHIYVANLTIIGSDNGLSPGRRQAIIWTNAGILLIRTLGTNFSEILSENHMPRISMVHNGFRTMLFTYKHYTHIIYIYIIIIVGLIT